MTADDKLVIANLATLVRRLALALRKAAPKHTLPATAMDYLRREGLCGSPLRVDTDDEAQP